MKRAFSKRQKSVDMLFAYGTKVQFVKSRDSGTVMGWLDHEMVRVKLDGSGMEIPAFARDLIRMEQSPAKGTGTKAKIVPGKKKSTSRGPERPPAETQYMVIKSLGLQLAFAPLANADGEVDKYTIYLINDTQYAILYNLELFIGGDRIFHKDGTIKAIEALEIEELLKDELNDSPVFHIAAWQLTTAGPGEKQKKQIKIKAQQFFKKVRTAPLLNIPVHHYRIFESFADQEKEEKEDLKAYTRRNSRPNYERDESSLNRYRDFDLQEAAEFIPEIDLHINSLLNYPQKLNKSKILRTQLEHFEKFMADAIRLGMTKVYVIHGIGEGKLKDHIASKLLQMPEVKTFKNEFHPKYGFGATEVTLS